MAGVGLLAAALIASSISAQARPAAHPAADGKPVAATSTKTSYGNGNYIVMMAGEPAAVYHGGVSGYKASAAAGSGKYNSTTAAAKAYTAHLKSEQNALAATVGVKAYYNYTTSFNGFAAKLTKAQATTLARQPGVLAVVPDEVRLADTTHTPSFLGLTGPVGLWRRLGGTDRATGAGKGVIIGIIDSGINDESAAFGPAGDGVPADWHGICDPGEDDSFSCNDKLIGGRYFDAAATVIPEEFNSPDDLHGHGTHVGATAAGDYGIESVIKGVSYGNTSGMAPAAKLAAYKVCWERADLTNCGAATSDSVAAIDAAVSDGVDVINYSISGATSDIIDPVEVAYMFAADAGVFVAASAGNSGPVESTVAHPSPWLTTVAAATHQISESTVVLGDGTEMIGASISPDSVPESPLVYAGDIPAEGADPADAALCFLDSIDPAQADGKIVICDRGVNARVEKGTVVADAGGVGMILVNVTPSGVVADVQDIPSIHLESNYRDALLAYAATDDPTAKFLAGVNTGTTTPEPPAIAGFSSRGPSLAAGGDLLKPDITAPGVDINAATAPEGGIGLGSDFAIISGTSMSSPHIAGLAALIIQAHPDWSPMEVKSAMMTTAKDLNDTTNAFDQGAGFVVPREFLDPGLVYNSDYDNWVDYLAGQGVTVGGEPISDTPIKASNLNLPSIAVNVMAGKETVKRSVTNVGDTTSTYKGTITGLDGVKATLKPSTLTLAPGETGSFKIKLLRTTAPFDEYTQGNLFWKDGGHIVRSPIVVSPSGVDAPGEVTVTGASKNVTTKAGFDGTMGHRVYGLVPGVDTAAEAGNSHEASDPLDDSNYFQFLRVSGPGAVVRIETLPQFDGDDLDLYLLDGNTGDVVASSATGSADELITATGLPKGPYFISVEAWAVHNDEDSTTFDVRTFKVMNKSAGNMKVTPATQPVKIGATQTWKVTTSGLEADTPYLGAIRWTEVKGGADNVAGLTLVSVN